MQKIHECNSKTVIKILSITYLYNFGLGVYFSLSGPKIRKVWTGMLVEKPLSKGIKTITKVEIHIIEQKNNGNKEWNE